jgi:subtilisin family serine protease
MTRRRCFAVLAAAAAAGSLAAATPARAAATVAVPDVSVLVVLRAQARLPVGDAPSLRERRLEVVRRLRAVAAGSQAPLLEWLRTQRANGLVTRVRPLWIVNAILVVAQPEIATQLAARADVAAVRPDAIVVAPAGTAASAAGTQASISQTRAPELWSRGVTGQGVVVATLDTGVDATHPDLAGRFRGGANSWYDPSGEHPATPTDVNGHGTWTTGVIVGGDAGGTAIGMAPDARWIAAKIFNDRGTSTASRIHQSFQWLLDPDDDPATDDAPDVVNGSWTMSAPGCNLEFAPDIQDLRSAGILPVFAAGNAGSLPGTDLSPADNPGALSVGSIDAASLIDPSSSRGPASCSPAPFPDLVAPGVDITTSDVFGGYTTQSGTSLAAPQVAGALALLRSAFPAASAERQESALEGSAADLGAAGPDDAYGFGQLDAAAAYDRLATVPDFDLAIAPASAVARAGTPASFTVTSTAANGFAEDVALSLEGLSPAQASWAFAPATVAGGTGNSTLTVTPAAALAPGTYSLMVHAVSGPVSHAVALTLVVPSPADFSVAVSPASTSVVAGSSTTATVSVSAAGGFTGPVSLSLSGLPSGATATFTPSSIATAGSSTLRIATAASTPGGSYSLSIVASGGGLVRTASLTLVVAGRDFGLSLTPAAATVRAGANASFTAGVSALNGFSGTVALAVAGAPSGTAATLSKTSLKPPGSATLKVTTTRSAARGTFTLTVTGTSGSLTHQATVQLTIVP